MKQNRRLDMEKTRLYTPMKKPKIEVVDEEEEPEEEESEDEETEEEQETREDTDTDNIPERIRQEREEELVALIEHRTRDVEQMRKRIKYYNSQLNDAERRLDDSLKKLALIRKPKIAKASENVTNGREEVEIGRKSATSIKINEDSFRKQPCSTPLLSGDGPRFVKTEDLSQSRTQSKQPLLIPALTPIVSQQAKIKESENKFSSGSVSQPTSSTPTLVSVPKQKGEKDSKLSTKQETMEKQPKGIKTKLVQREHQDVIKLIGKSSSPFTIDFQSSCLLSSQHKRKLRSLALCPANDHLFVTSALDGVVNLWEVQRRSSSANLLSSTDCLSDKRRWPEDIAWHPQGDRLFSVYSADDRDSQVSILNLNKKERARVTFMKDNPHLRGVINSLKFLPWDEKSFITGGSDHAVILWSEQDEEDSWKIHALHRNYHSSAVMGVAAMQHKNIVLSAGADKRIIAFDVLSGRSEYKRQTEAKCMSVLPNPCDFNLFMVQTGTPERQLRLFDIRLRQDEIHTFGFKQESSDSQSALINQCWSPNGLHLSSGSVDPVIHIFDIRYNAKKPSQSIKAHHKRVFKAAWHHALPLLISISSDLNIGLHEIS